MSAYDPFDPRYRDYRDARTEYEEIRRRLDCAEKEISYWRDVVAKTAAQGDYVQNEIVTYRKYIKLLELALHMAAGDDEKKAEILASAKKSIEVLTKFEK
jgi:hypothetical protein